MKGTIRAFLIVTYVFLGISLLEVLPLLFILESTSIILIVSFAISLTVTIIAHVKLERATSRKELLPIAIITLLALMAALGIELWEMFTTPGYLDNINNVLHHLLTVVVGLEFVRMLIDTTPANILEVLTVAITRHVVLSHDDYWSNLACVACIAGLFAIRRYLIRRHELKEEMIDEE